MKRHSYGRIVGLLVMLGVCGGCGPADTGGEPKPDGGLEDAGETESGKPTLQVVESMTFEGASIGSSVRKQIAIENAGSLPLVVERVALSEGEADEVEEFAKGEPWFDGAEIAPGASKSLAVVYTPQNALEDRGQLTFRTNDPDRAEVTVALQSLELGDPPPSPCLKMTPPDQTFGEVEGGMSKTREVVLEHCREDGPPLRVEYWRLTGRGFRMDSEIGAPFEIPAGGSVAMPIVFEPTGRDSYRGRLRVETDAPAHRSFDVELTGEGTRDMSGCPDAVATAGIEGGTGQGGTDLATEPFETVVLDGAGSTDPDGAINRFIWSLVKQPMGSSAVLLPNRNARRPRLFVDMAGTYQVELSVEDESGLRECDSPARVTITATPEEEVYVELVWRTPKDPLRGDSVGADLDLHYMNRTKGSWNQGPWDIFSGNKTADWGREGYAKDDPTLRREDADGRGPEVVGHDNVATSGEYAIGVHYFDSDGFGHSYASVRVYIDGALKGEYLNKYLKETDTFWHVANIDWPMKAPQKREKIHEGFPN